MSFAKVVARILRDAPVTDPRAALAEIERAVKLNNAAKVVQKKLAPKLAKITATQTARGTDGSVEVEVKVEVGAQLSAHQKTLVLECINRSVVDSINELKVGV